MERKVHMEIYVDADACPVVDTILEEVIGKNITVHLVRSYSHYSHQDYPSFVKVTYVDTGSDAVDYRIIGMAKAKDIIVTQDYGLAALGLEKKLLCHSSYWLPIFQEKKSTKC